MMSSEQVEEDYNQDVIFLSGDAYLKDEYEYFQYLMAIMEERKAKVKEEKHYIEFQEVGDNKLPF